MKRKTVNPNRLLGLISLLLIGWFIYWFTTHYEREYIEIRTGLSAQARQNSLLAAERFLSILGVEAESLSGREHLLYPPSESGVLLVRRLGPDLTLEQEERVSDWLLAGGHLIATPPAIWSEEEQSGHRLLDHYGVRCHLNDNDVWFEDEMPLLDMTVPGFADVSIQLAFDPSFVLEDSLELADWSLQDNDGQVHVLSIPIGEGRLTLLSDLELLTNEEIGRGDHAFLLAQLVGDAWWVWLLYSSHHPSLLTLLWRVAPWLLISLGLLLVFWLWFMLLRTGPILPETSDQRRNLLEHLDASAHYAWRTDQGRQLFAQSRQVILQHWQHRHPILNQLNQEDRLLWLSKRTGLTVRSLQTGLFDEPADEHDLIKMTSVLQKLAATR